MHLCLSTWILGVRVPAASMSQSSVYCVQVVVRVKPNYSHLSIDHKQHGEGNATLAYGRHAFLDRTPVYLDLRACHPQGVRGAQHRGTALRRKSCSA